jgi:hypothetical protein
MTIIAWTSESLIAVFHVRSPRGLAPGGICFHTGVIDATM